MLNLKLYLTFGLCIEDNPAPLGDRVLPLFKPECLVLSKTKTAQHKIYRVVFLSVEDGKISTKKVKVDLYNSKI